MSNNKSSASFPIIYQRALKKRTRQRRTSLEKNKTTPHFPRKKKPSLITTKNKLSTAYLYTAQNVHDDLFPVVSMCSQLCTIIIVNMNLCWYFYTDGNIIMLEWNRDMLIITQIALLSENKTMQQCSGIIITM